MPKENIMDESYQRVAYLVSSDGKEEGHLVTDAFVSVKWGRENSHVQLVCCTDRDPDGLEAQHVSLDRAGINRMIRTLRKARDAAYGSDA